MTILGFALVLTAAFCHATWNYFVKSINGGPELVWLFSSVPMIIYLPVAVYIWIIGQPIFGVWELAFIAGGAVLHLGNFLLPQAGYRKDDLSLVYPTTQATGPFLSTAFAVIVLGESMSLHLGLEALAIIIGVVCLTGGFKGGLRNAGTSVLFGFGAGLLIGGYTVWDAYAAGAALAIGLHLLHRTFGAVAPIALKRMDQVKAHWRNHRTGVVIIAILNPWPMSWCSMP